MTWLPKELINMVCRVCKKDIGVSQKFTVCQFKAKDGTITRWLRCELCQRKAEVITGGSVLVVDSKTVPMTRGKYSLPKRPQ